ncbi:MAG: diaminopimelate epimerase [bacterium]
MKIPFSKMSGCGNDFILIDNRECILSTPIGELTQMICDRHNGVGADGLIIIEKSDTAHFKMRFYNSDGGEAEMCGNGARCVARFAYLTRIAPAKMTFETRAGEIEGQVLEDGHVKITMGRIPFKLSEGRIDSIEDGPLYYLTVGVPHTVFFVDTIDTVDVFTRGRSIRYHEKFAPAGTNVNFVKVLNQDSLVIRTYERGVEAETMACGTGASASAIVAFSLGFVKMPVHVYTKNNCLLVIDFKYTHDVFDSLILQGEARMICDGFFFINSLR